MQHPTQCQIAVFGTTSSGKSTLINLLIGDMLLPSGVQEMTAGITKVKHHWRRKQLIDNFDNSSPIAVKLSRRTARSELNEYITHSYHAYLDQQRSTEPSFLIEWPIHIASKAHSRNKQVRDLIIVDTPGLKFIGDKNNSKTIPDDTSALLVVFGADETDHYRQRALLDHVLAQKPDLDSLIFVLNKVDILLTDHDPISSQARVEERLREIITDSIKKYYPYKRSIRIKLHPIAARPALYANIISSYGSYESAWRRLLKTFLRSPLLKYEVEFLERLLREHMPILDMAKLADLPPNISEWPISDRRAFLSPIYERTGTASLEQTLLNKIAGPGPLLLTNQRLSPTGS